MTALLLGVNQITPGNDLNGAQVTRVRTLSRFLDSEQLGERCQSVWQP